MNRNTRELLICAQKSLLTAILVVVFASSGWAQDIPPSSNKQEIFLSFSYSGLVNSVITAYYYRDSVYIPIGAVFKQLRIDETADMRAKTLKGFYIRASDKYDIDFSKGIAEIGGRRIRFDTAKVIIGPLDFYALPSFFKTIFGLSFTVDFNSLSLALNTQKELPVLQDYRRQTRRNYMVVSPELNLIQAPLAFPRHRHLLDGGILDYSLSAYTGGNQSAYTYQFTGGGEVLGGETEGSLLGTSTGAGSKIYSSDLSWKYAFDSTSYITYAGLGNLYSNGLTQFGFRGAQVSNEPLTVRTLFSQYIVHASTNPGWDVELYLNGQLVGYKKADKQGRAQFSIPLVYGTSFIQLKYYGPNGQFNEVDRRLQIPFSFVPAGEVNYTVGGGKLNNTNYNFLSANVIYGFTSWLSDKVGVDYVDNPYFSKPLFYNSLYLRLGPQYTISFDAAPLAFYRSTFSALYASQAAFDLSYSRYRENLLYNPSLKIQEGQADLYVPFSLGGSSFNFRATGNAQEYSLGQKAYNYSAYLSTSVSQLNATIGYLKSIIDYGHSNVVDNYTLSASVLYSMFFGQGPFEFLNGTLVNATGRYGVLKNSLDDISFQLSRNVLRYIRIGFSAERDYINRATTFNLQIIADLPFTRSTTGAQVRNGAGYYTENLSGSIGYDSNYKTFLFNNLPWVGRSAASIRMFVDANGNGKYDKGEEIIKNGEVTLRQAVASETSSDGIIRDWNLLPYTQYSADVDLSSIRNPLWIPKLRSFSFITDPNSYKRIDVPFFVGGIVEGKVLRLAGTKMTSVPGLTLYIKSKSTGRTTSVSVFNDGSFYYMGLQPGEYEAYVDSTQLSVLGVYADPAILNFNIKPTKNGDFVEGLKIILKQIEKRTPPRKLKESSGKIYRPLEKYVVQIGAFVSRKRAEVLAKRARIMTGQILMARPSKQLGLFVVQTDTFDSRQTALQRLTIFIDEFGFFDAFVNSTTRPHARYIYWVQIAAFASVDQASQFVRRNLKETDLRLSVRFRRSTNLFSVMAGPFKNDEAATRALDKLELEHGFRRAFVVIDGESNLPRRYTIELAEFDHERQARSFALDFRLRTGILALVGFDCERLKFRAFTPTFSTEKEAWTAMGKIRSYGEYPSARIISLP